ncbi:MAG: pyridoxamine 5'-phosphate oxidase family protein [Armatimonadota bacterium]
MTKDEIYAFLNANPVCFLATTEDCQPRVRGMMLFRADEQGIVFHTGQGKDLVKQLEVNPTVELCAFNPQTMVQVRVSGTAAFDNDLTTKQAIVARHEFLKPLVEQYGYDFLVVFIVKGRNAAVWTMATNMEPKTLIDL